MSADATDRARKAMADWEGRRPGNFFAADLNLQEVLRLHLDPQRYANELPGFERFGREVAAVIDPAARETDRRENLPSLRRFDAVGQRTEAIVFHPAHHAIGRAVYGSGVASGYSTPGNERVSLVAEYLLSQCGEAGHACPVACTAGLIKILQAVGAPDVRERFLPRLLDPDYATHHVGAQFLTEIQGGSDVGANAARAEAAGEGLFRIHGEKWFCSVIDADLFLLTARPSGAPQGTEGLGAFVVPRHLEDGSPNGFRIRRLKDKLGTRSMASAEVDFEGALAWPVGPLERGFKNVVEIVLTTSRVFNAVCSAGFMRRAEVEAFGYAATREAFGRRIAEFPAVQETLARIKVETRAALASTWRVIAMGDCAATDGLDADEGQALRALVILNKLLTSVRATETVHDAMEVLGGNGAIEEFSVLPRLYRDAYVVEAWEGTHNVLAAQLLRDFQRLRTHEGLLRWMDASLEGKDGEATRTVAALLDDAVRRARKSVEEVLAADAARASLASRPLCDELTVVAQGLCLLQEARWTERNGLDSEKPLVAEHFVRTRVARQALGDDRGRLERLRRLTSTGE